MSIRSRRKKGGSYCSYECMNDGEKGMSIKCQKCILNTFNEQTNLGGFFKIFAQSPKMKKPGQYTEETKTGILKIFKSFLPNSKNEKDLKKQWEEYKKQREFLMKKKLVYNYNTISEDFKDDSLGSEILDEYIQNLRNEVTEGGGRKSRRKTRRGGKRRIYRHLAVKAFLKKTKRRRKKRKTNKKKKQKKRTKKRR